MKKYFTIGEFSRLLDIKIATLRYYDEIGLLRPAFIDENNNYRYYSTEQFERLNSIKYLRALDLPINELLDFFDYREIDTLIEMLKKQKAEIARKKRELEIIEKKINRRLERIDDAVNTALDTISEVELPEMRAAYLRHDYVLGDDIEFPISELRTMFGINRDIFLGKIGISISSSNIKSENFNQYSGIFMLIEEEDKIEAPTITFPSRNYLRIRFKGTHMDASYYYKKLLSYMKKKHYKLIGDSIEITLIDYGITNDLDKYVTEILLPFVHI
ncbi:MerR family transcriptional regulator [Priestia megaterium]|jgi:effector-binding domain-containing protein/DNA-binding transcriptional MerR regulator|uniref:MerR family transcriptional regulator n=1 Tax=Priestia megaterium TaxID=1404 RepID=A0ABD4WSD3_PRIMG|nr:MerR family transcriptional regulator [Priestia megaterium]MDD9783121.1 MerR family transcriptional regulator [Priestia megaterium]